MENDALEHKKKNGIYYTPMDLAEYLVKPMMDCGYQTFFDPAYGEGALLLAAEKEHQKIDNKRLPLGLFGCDTHPVNGLLTHLPQANLREANFFDIEVDDKYDAILTNPPYIRHQEQDKLQVKLYKSKFEDLKTLSNSSDLWAYFVVKAGLHLNKGGAMAAVLPWSVLQADYATDFRSHLLTKFESIRILALNKPYFEGAQERIVLLWLHKFGSKNKSISIAFAKSIEDTMIYRELDPKDWVTSKVLTTSKSDLTHIFSTLQVKYGFKEFCEFADVRIGVVTGANKYFVKDVKEARALGFNGRNLIAILTSAKELPDYIKNGRKNLKKLLIITEKTANRYTDYIKLGVDAELDQRSHSLSRKPWFHVREGITPDAFFPYRVGTIPYLVLNDNGVQSTNSVHRVYFKNINRTQQKWIHISMLSVYGQLSFEFRSKTYGRGMLKLEPGGLYKCLVKSSNDDCVDEAYDTIIEHLKTGNKVKAMGLATDFINIELGISEDFCKKVLKQYEELQSSKTR